jgi:hypothetical protein
MINSINIEDMILETKIKEIKNKLDIDLNPAIEEIFSLALTSLKSNIN